MTRAFLIALILLVATGSKGIAEPSSNRSQNPALPERAILYEEDHTNRKGKRYVGTVIWRTEVASAPGQGRELGVRAEIKLPEPRVTVKWSLRRNIDKALPASHTIEIMFTLPPDFPNGGISNIPGILMKQAEQTRGVPLAGLAVKVTADFFLIGLSSSEADAQRNIQLLKEQTWFDIPIVYSNGRRSILSLEKGNVGERVFEEAFRAWSGYSDLPNPTNSVVQTQAPVELATPPSNQEDKDAALGLIWASTIQQVIEQGVELKKIPQTDFGELYFARNLPRALSDQETAVLSFGYDDKLCRIAIISRAFDKDPAGRAAQQRYSELLTVLAEKYGRPLSVHQIDNSMYKEEKDFLAGINNGRSNWFSNYETPTLKISVRYYCG